MNGVWGARGVQYGQQANRGCWADVGGIGAKTALRLLHTG
jgi:hypothetical protein